MPAESVKQRRFFGIVKGIKSREIVKSFSAKAAKVAKMMKMKAIKHFAKTKEGGLPMRKKKSNPGSNSTETNRRFPNIQDVSEMIKKRKKKRSKFLEELDK